MSSLFSDVLVIASVMWANVKWFAEPGGVAEDESSAAAQVRLLRRLSKHSSETLNHKVLTYVEYRAVSGVFQNIERRQTLDWPLTV
jgi:hypothetical protein